MEIKHESDIGILESKVNNLIVNNNPTEGNSELIDIRAGSDGTNWYSAGEHVRAFDNTFSKRVVPYDFSTGIPTNSFMTCNSIRHQYYIEYQVHYKINPNITNGKWVYFSNMYSWADIKSLIGRGNNNFVVEIVTDKEVYVGLEYGFGNAYNISIKNNMPLNKSFLLKPKKKNIIEFDLSSKIFQKCIKINESQPIPSIFNYVVLMLGEFDKTNFAEEGDYNFKVSMYYTKSKDDFDFPFIPETEGINSNTFVKNAGIDDAIIYKSRNIPEDIRTSDDRFQLNFHDMYINLFYSYGVYSSKSHWFAVSVKNVAEFSGKRVFVYKNGDDFYPSTYCFHIGFDAPGTLEQGIDIAAHYISFTDLLHKYNDAWSYFDFDEYYPRIQEHIDKVVNLYPDYKHDGKLWFFVYGAKDANNYINRKYTFAISIQNPNNLVVNPLVDQNLQNLNATLSSLETTVNTQNQIITKLQNSNVLWGKKFVACGDSYTEWADEKYPTGHPYAGQYITFDREIRLRNNMSGYNDGISGTIIALDKDYVANPTGVGINTRKPFTYQRMYAIPEDTDYCTIAFGLNDGGHTNLGTINDTTNETFYGAWNVCLKWIIQNRPLMKTGIILWQHISPNYNNAIIECCKKWGFPYFDTYGDIQVPVTIYGRKPGLGLCTEAETLRHDFFGGKGNRSHPGKLAQVYKSTYIENFLRSL